MVCSLAPLPPPHHCYVIVIADVAPLKKLFPVIISIMWPILFLEYEGNFIQKFHQELITKWILNRVSAGAQILGKILCNCMVDLQSSNSKLFWSAESILQFTGHSQARCLDSLLQVKISTHILVATEKTKVFPTALLCLLRNCSVQETRMCKDTSHSIHAAIEASLNAPRCKRRADKSDAASRIT
ncbi:LOW QUALITY PROTEIN: glucokinase regulatory protein [Phoenicopterus ruber ruber]